MIALDALEQMDPQSFELVGAHARGDRFSRCIEIGGNLGLVEWAHRHAGKCCFLKKDRSVTHDGDRGVELMTMAGEVAQLRHCLGGVGRLAELAFPKRQGLIGADDVATGSTR